jgi:Radical SAM superfamily
MRPAVFHVFLVRPSKYDDEGFVIRHWRAVVPSNSLACLYGLTEDVRQGRVLGEVDLRIHVVDEAVNKIPLGRIFRLNGRAGERVLVCLVGVQTNQVCRAADIALALRRKQVAVMLGGFHVSGMLAMFPTVSPEIQQLVDAGVSVVAGEVEHRWADLLRDAYEGKLKPIYRFLDDPPDLSDAPPPIKHKQFTAKHIHSNYGTIDCSRGCPFNCSFCTIINVQGRKSRYRSPECILGTIRQTFRYSGVNLYFFTDDNFARNPAWEEIFDRLISLREDEGIAIEFVIQADIASHGLPGFIDKAVRAGCCSVFIGMESLNPRNLQAAGKTQNRVQEYRASIEAWQNARVTTLVGYIIGFPYDTEESVRCDIRRLIREVQPDQASFFMLAPLPGSRDHRCMIEDGSPMEADYNRFDCFHETTTHPHMEDGAWTRAYAEAWRRFYSLENMKAILSRTHPDRYWDVFYNLFWYKNSVVNEGTHPMLTGFVRLKDRVSRRACFPQESHLAHLRRRIPEIAKFVRGTLRVALEMEELWLATRKRSETEVRVIKEVAVMRAELRGRLRISDLQAAYIRAKARMPSIEVPSRLSLFRERASLLRVSCLRQTRRDLARFWIGVRREFRRGRIGTVLWAGRIALNALREIRLAASFLTALMTGGAIGKANSEGSLSRNKTGHLPSSAG